MSTAQRIGKILPEKVRDRVDPYLEAIDIVAEMRDPRVLASIGPSAARGMISEAREAERADEDPGDPLGALRLVVSERPARDA